MCCLPVWLTMGVRRQAGGRGAAGCRAGLRARLLLCLKVIGSFDGPIDAAIKDDQLVVVVVDDDNGGGDAAQEEKSSSRLATAAPPLPSFVRRSLQVPPGLRPTSKKFRVQRPFEPNEVEREGIAIYATNSQYVLWVSPREYKVHVSPGSIHAISSFWAETIN